MAQRLIDALQGNPTVQEVREIPRASPDDIVEMLKGVPAGAAGLPVDVVSEFLRGVGYSVPREKTVGSTEWWGKRLGANPESGPFIAGQFASPDPLDAARVSKLLTDALQAMTVFHGSPHKWSKVDLSKAGTGEGAQAYGHGFYVAENPKVAGDYQRKFAREIAGGDTGGIGLAERLRESGASDNDVLKEIEWRRANSNDPKFQARLDQARDWVLSGNAPSHLYELDLPDETIAKMLDWDKPLREQPEVLEKVQRLVGNNPEMLDALPSATGQQLYERLLPMTDMARKEPDLLSRELNSLGIPGIKYFDGSSRKITGADRTRQNLQEARAKLAEWSNSVKPSVYPRDVIDSQIKMYSDQVDNLERYLAQIENTKGTRNFVIFDENVITPLTRNGEPIR